MPWDRLRWEKDWLGKGGLIGCGDGGRNVLPRVVMLSSAGITRLDRQTRRSSCSRVASGEFVGTEPRLQRADNAVGDRQHCLGRGGGSILVGVRCNASAVMDGGGRGMVGGVVSFAPPPPTS